MDRDRLVAHDGAVAAVRDEPGRVGREAGEEGFEDEDGGGFVGGRVGVSGFEGGVLGVVRVREEFGLSALGGELFADVLLKSVSFFCVLYLDVDCKGGIP